MLPDQASRGSLLMTAAMRGRVSAAEAGSVLSDAGGWLLPRLQQVSRGPGKPLVAGLVVISAPGAASRAAWMKWRAGAPGAGPVAPRVVSSAGATASQVVLAWLTGAEVPVIPVVGASSVAQLDESLAAADLELTTEQRTRLDTAR
jgi:hypothetical protein